MAGCEWFWHYVSPRVTDWLGFEADELLGHMWTRRIHPADRDLTIDAANQLQAGLHPAPFSQRWITAARREILVQLEVWWLDHPSGVHRLAGRLTNLSVEDHAHVSTVVAAQKQIGPTARETPTAARGFSGGMPPGYDFPEGDRATSHAAVAAACAATERRPDVTNFDTRNVDGVTLAPPAVLVTELLAFAAALL